MLGWLLTRQSPRAHSRVNLQGTVQHYYVHVSAMCCLEGLMKGTKECQQQTPGIPQVASTIEAPLQPVHVYLSSTEASNTC